MKVPCAAQAALLDRFCPDLPQRPRATVDRLDDSTTRNLHGAEHERHDDNVLPAVQEKFAATYRAAGGVCELTIFEGS